MHSQGQRAVQFDAIRWSKFDGPKRGTKFGEPSRRFVEFIIATECTLLNFYKTNKSTNKLFRHMRFIYLYLHHHLVYLFKTNHYCS